MPEKELSELVSDIFKLRPEDVKLELPLTQIRGWNSLRFVQLIKKIEERYGVLFHAHELTALGTWSQIRDLVGSKLSAPG